MSIWSELHESHGLSYISIWSELHESHGVSYMSHMESVT